jgi:hypothetical protein
MANASRLIIALLFTACSAGGADLREQVEGTLQKGVAILCEYLELGDRLEQLE